VRSGLALLLASALLQASPARAREALGISVPSRANPFAAALVEGAVAAAERAGLELVVKDAGDDADQQVADLEELLRRKVKVLLVLPVDAPALAPALDRADEAGVPVISVGARAAGGPVAYHVASDDVAGGRLAGEYTCRLLGGRGEVAELEGHPAVRDRGQGFLEGLRRGCRGVKLVARETAQADRAEGLTVAESLLEAHPSVAAIFAEDDEMALGAVHARQLATRRVHIVGYGASADALKAVESCDLAATVAPQPGQMGRVAVERALALERPGRAPARTVTVLVAPKLVVGPSCR